MFQRVYSFLKDYIVWRFRGETTCVLDYIWHEVKGKRGFKTYTYQKLAEEFVDFNEMHPYTSTQEIIDWVKECHRNISVRAYSSTYKKIHETYC